MPQPSSQPRSASSLNPSRKEIRKLKRLFEQERLTLDDYHAIGQEMSRLAADTILAGYGSRWRKKVAAILGQSDSTLTKCLQFFTQYRDPDELAELQRMEVGWVQLIIALGISDKKQRHYLLRRARDEKWGQRELRREARRLKGSYRGGGRPRKPEKSRGCLADASELLRRTEHWSAFYGEAWSGNDKTYMAELDRLSDDARGDLVRVLTDAAGRLRTLQKQCAEAFKTVNALLRKLPQGE